MNYETKVSLYPFAISIASNKPLRGVNKNGAEYVEMKDGAEYAFILHNQHYTQCDATVRIDGELIGTFRVYPNSKFHIERPGDTARKFVFVKAKSARAAKAGVEAKSSSNGLIQVNFQPEKRPRTPQPTYRGLRNRDEKEPEYDEEDLGFGLFEDDECESKAKAKGRQSAGATLLGKESTQRFDSVAPLTRIDYSTERTISLRLVIWELEPVGEEPELSLRRHYSSMVTANLVPPPVSL